MIDSKREGFLYGLAAYVWWGLVPLYFHWLGKTDPGRILAHRIIWSAVFLAFVLTLMRRWSEMLRVFGSAQMMGWLILSAFLVAVNWLLYIVCVHYGKIVQASLGYFIVPLMNIALGLVIFRERLRPLQHFAIGFAVLGVLWLTQDAGELPWLALIIALSFCIYGIIRKKVPVDGLIGLMVETIVLLPIAAGYLAFQYVEQMGFEDGYLLFRLSLSGVVSAVPLMCFGQAARRLPFTTLGFLQYLSPSLQFLLAVYLFDETMPGGWFTFILIWTALTIFSVDSIRWHRRQEKIFGEAT